MLLFIFYILTAFKILIKHTHYKQVNTIVIQIKIKSTKIEFIAFYLLIYALCNMQTLCI